MAGYDALSQEFTDEGISIFAASVDPDDKVQEVQNEVSFPICSGVTRETADQLGSWWEDRRDIIQPSEFVLDSSGKVLSATYSSGPIGRLDAADALWLVQFLKKRAEAS